MERMNRPRRKTLKTLDLIAGIGWSIKKAEQRHKSSTLTKQLHKRYGKYSMIAKSYAHTLKHIVSPEADNEAERKLKEKIAIKERRQSSRVGGYGLYLKDACAIN